MITSELVNLAPTRRQHDFGCVGAFTLLKLFQQYTRRAAPVSTVSRRPESLIFQQKSFESRKGSVKGLGNFVEIEYKGEKKVDHKIITAQMVEFLKTMNCGTIELNNGGYPMLLLFSEDAHYIKV